MAIPPQRLLHIINSIGLGPIAPTLLWL